VPKTGFWGENVYRRRPKKSRAKSITLRSMVNKEVGEGGNGVKKHASTTCWSEPDSLQ